MTKRYTTLLSPLLIVLISGCTGTIIPNQSQKDGQASYEASFEYTRPSESSTTNERIITPQERTTPPNEKTIGPEPTGPEPTGPEPTGPEPTGPEPTVRDAGPEPTLPDTPKQPDHSVTPEPTVELPPEPPPTGSCNALSAISGSKSWTIKHDGVTRTFTVYIPKSYKPTQRTPIVLNFHGVNSNAWQQQFISDMNAVADKKGFITVHPEGRSNSWNGGLCCSPASSLLKSKDVDFVRKMLDYIEGKLCIDKKRVFAAGLSNGAYMAYRLACELSDRIAAVSPVAGLLLSSPCKPVRPISVIAFHGTSDAIVPYNGYPLIGWISVPNSVKHFYTHNKCNSAPQQVFKKGDTTCEEYSGCQAGTKVRLCTTQGGGHTWPGGFPVPGLGKTTKDINASETMWTFFQQHPLP